MPQTGENEVIQTATHPGRGAAARTTSTTESPAEAPRRRRGVVLRAGVLSVLAASASVPAASAETGLHGVLVLEGKEVPLPAGDWVQAGRFEAPDMVSVALLQSRDGAVAEAVLVQTSRRDRPPAWGDAPLCEATDLPLAKTRYKSDHDLSCAYVAHVAGQPADAEVDPAWAEARRSAAARGWRLPEAWGVVAVRVTQPLSAVQVRYAAALNPAGGPEPLALADWAGAAWDKVDIGLRNQLDPQASLPALQGHLAPPAPPAAPAEEGFTVPRAVWKTITFRVVYAPIDFTSNYIASGSLLTAAGLSALPLLIGPWIYLAHELAWDYFGGPAELQTDLRGLGEETAWPPAGPAGRAL